MHPAAPVAHTNLNGARAALWELRNQGPGLGRRKGRYCGKFSRINFHEILNQQVVLQRENFRVWPGQSSFDSPKNKSEPFQFESFLENRCSMPKGLTPRLFPTKIFFRLRLQRDSGSGPCPFDHRFSKKGLGRNGFGGFFGESKIKGAGQTLGFAVNIAPPDDLFLGGTHLREIARMRLVCVCLGLALLRNHNLHERSIRLEWCLLWSLKSRKLGRSMRA